jgi:restriction endonuclease
LDALVLAIEETAKLGLKEIKRIHQVWGHCKAEKLEQVIKNAKKWSEEVSKHINEVIKTCDSCAILNNRFLRPKSAPPSR